MNKLGFLTIIFFVLFIISFPFSYASSQIYSLILIITIFVALLGLYIFLAGCRIKKIGKIRFEAVQFPFTYVLRAYTKPKNLWIVYDETTKKFRSADWRDFPVRVFLLTLFGIGMLYVSFIMWFTISQLLALIMFRLIVVFLFFVMGLYSLCVGLYRLFSINNKNADVIYKFLNKNRILTNLIEKGKLYVHVSPNFLFKEGFVDSVEFILAEKVELEKLEKIVIETARMMQKL